MGMQEGGAVLPRTEFDSQEGRRLIEDIRRMQELTELRGMDPLNWYDPPLQDLGRSPLLEAGLPAERFALQEGERMNTAMPFHRWAAPLGGAPPPLQTKTSDTAAAGMQEGGPVSSESMENIHEKIEELRQKLKKKEQEIKEKYAPKKPGSQEGPPRHPLAR